MVISLKSKFIFSNSNQCCYCLSKTLSVGFVLSSTGSAAVPLDLHLSPVPTSAVRPVAMFTLRLSVICTTAVPVSQSGGIQLLGTMWYAMAGKNWIFFPEKCWNKTTFTAFHCSEKRLNHQLVLMCQRHLCEHREREKNLKIDWWMTVKDLFLNIFTSFQDYPFVLVWCTQTQ